MTTFYLKYGKELKQLKIDDKNFAGMITPNESKVKYNSIKELRKALKNPIHSKRLKDIVKQGEKVAVITSDITRPMPQQRCSAIDNRRVGTWWNQGR